MFDDLFDERTKTNIVAVICFLLIIACFGFMVTIVNRVTENDLENVGDSEEPYVQSLEYTLSDDGTYYIVTGIGSYTESKLIIADCYDGLPVKAIGKNAFYNCDFLNEVILPDTICSIGESAFSRSGIEHIEIPDSVTKLDNYVFWDCSYLYSICINPITLREICDGVFEMCDSLRDIYFRCSIDEFSGYEESNVGILNSEFFKATWYYYSEEYPIEGNFWCYVNGVPSTWKNY